MARFNGVIGFSQTVETSPGIYTEQIVERAYCGDILKDSRNLENGVTVNTNIRLGNRFSIVADNFALENHGFMKYVKWGGALWKISNIEIQRPRLILVVGEHYNA